MAKIDMHLHSKYSGRPADWFLQKFGTNVCYTEPEEIYKQAVENKMDFITITDNNSIEASLILKNKYPEKVITGCELSTYFPEDNCEIHILLYGITENQFNEIILIQHDIYKIREYIINNDIAYSVAHPTYSINGKLDIMHLEKLILLFNIFEGINGSRNKIGNKIWTDVLTSLSPQKIKKLEKKYKINPIGNDPWIKGITGGSDDHALLFIGKTYTECAGETIDDFLNNLKNKKTLAVGRHNDYRSLAFTIYKILYDFSKNQRSRMSNSFINELLDLIYAKKELGFINWIKIKAIKAEKLKNKDSFKAHFYDLVDGLQKNTQLPFDKKFDFIFQKISDIIDSFIKSLIKSTKKSIKKGDLMNIFKNISSILPGVFLTIPFFTTLFHMYSVRPLANKLEKSFLSSKNKRKKKILWFVDTINALNGVSVTCKKIGWHCSNTNRNLKLVSSITESEIDNEIPPYFINLPFLYKFDLPNYETINLKVPSILKTIEMLYEYEPDEIYISTPGPVGILGLFFAKLTSAMVTGVYHTDFAAQARSIVNNETVADAIEISTKWFYSKMDKISVPTQEYIDILRKRHFDTSKLKIFKRGIDDDFLKDENYKEYDINSKNFTMFFSGRISEDKNIDFLLEVHKKLLEKHKNLKLVIAGYGPYYNKLNKKAKKIKNITLKGYVKRNKLPKLYALSDLFVFPSNTDTFGMVVLEAQCCGVPAIVTDIGGPREIVIDNKTGYIQKTDSIDSWVNKIDSIIHIRKKNPEKFIKLRENSRKNVIENYNWEHVLSILFEETQKKS